jgi:DNA polymerase III epsilon subunit-like protein
MKYVSIDIETTGLDPDKCDVLEVAAVVDDLTCHNRQSCGVHELPSFRYVFMRDSYRGDPYALSMHPKLFAEIAARRAGYESVRDQHTTWYNKPCCFGDCFHGWLHTQRVDPMAFNVIGKNFANFDARFLRRIDCSPRFKWNYRIMDVASMFALSTDEYLPSTGECCERAGIYPADEIDGNKHDALFDARVVVALVRKALL